VLNAAVGYENLAPASSGNDLETMADDLRADGGQRDQHKGDECACTPNFPCADCFINGERGFPE